ncbi:hypothetical protein ACKWTF_001619 [Chironomus riparius]
MQKHVNSAGDFKLPDHKHLNSKECQTILQRKVPEHVVKWDHECHQLTSRRSSGSQRMLRYLLKLSSNTFYAELQQEIDVLKQEKKALEGESNFHSHSISEILKNQSDVKLVIIALM